MIGSWDSAFSIVTRVWAGQSGVEILVGATDISLLQNIETSCRAYPASCFIGTKIFFPRVKWLAPEGMPALS